MDIKQLRKIQISQDEELGFSLEFKDQKSKYDQLTKELVGLFGEIGEFSNIVKKINLKLEYENYKFDIETAKEGLAEEFVDSLIYLLRISEILNIDIEKETIKKIKKNRERYIGIK